MTLTTVAKRSALMLGALGVFSTGSLAIANSAEAASVELGTWTRIGDALVTPSGATLTNATPGIGDIENPGVSNPNVSGFFPLTSFGTGSDNFAQSIGFGSNAQLNSALGLTVTPSAPGYREGSAIRNTSFAATAGEVFTFDWNFSLKDAPDIGFVKVNNSLFSLGSTPFFYTFANTGVYDIAIGVVDVNNFSRSSVLNVSNAQIVPTPALLPGLVGLGVAALRKRKQNAAR